MLAGLLLTLNIIVCIALIGVVLLQRSEGGALGGGSGPTGLVTARGAGDLLTKTTWALFALFLALSLGQTLWSAHERSSSAIIQRLKLQSVNPNALPSQRPASQTTDGQAAPPPATSPSAPKPTVQFPGSAPAQSAPASPFSAPAPVISLPPLPGAPAPAKPAKP
jgi:preprotein translocase subunit SecG